MVVSVVVHALLVGCGIHVSLPSAADNASDGCKSRTMRTMDVVRIQSAAGGHRACYASRSDSVACRWDRSLGGAVATWTSYHVGEFTQLRALVDGFCVWSNGEVSARCVRIPSAQQFGLNVAHEIADIVEVRSQIFVLKQDGRIVRFNVNQSLVAESVFEAERVLQMVAMGEHICWTSAHVATCEYVPSAEGMDHVEIRTLFRLDSFQDAIASYSVFCARHVGGIRCVELRSSRRDRRARYIDLDWPVCRIWFESANQVCAAYRDGAVVCADVGPYAHWQRDSREPMFVVIEHDDEGDL